MKFATLSAFVAVASAGEPFTKEEADAAGLKMLDAPVACEKYDDCLGKTEWDWTKCADITDAEDADKPAQTMCAAWGICG